MLLGTITKSKINFNMKRIVTILIPCLLLSSCAHHRDVRPGTNGIHRVEVQGSDKGFVSRNALSQANDFCKEQKKYAAIIEESVKYVGTMDEKTYNAARTASTVATVAGVGTGAYAVARKKTMKSNVSKVAVGATAAGILGNTIISNGYLAEMRFKCE